MLRLSSSFRFWYSKRSSFHSILKRTFGRQLPDISSISMIVLKWAWSQTLKHQISISKFRAVNLSLWIPPRYPWASEVSPWRRLPSRPPSRESCSPARPRSPSPRSPPPRHTGSWCLSWSLILLTNFDNPLLWPDVSRVTLVMVADKQIQPN